MPAMRENLGTRLQMVLLTTKALRNRGIKVRCSIQLLTVSIAMDVE